MAEGHGRDAWNHTAALLCKLHNVNCAKKSDLIRDPSVFNPYAERNQGKARKQRVTVAALSAAFGFAPLATQESRQCLGAEKSPPAVQPSRPA